MNRAPTSSSAAICSVPRSSDPETEGIRRNRSQTVGVEPVPHPGPDDRHLRSASIIDIERINAYPITIVGVGAIGSHLAEILAKLGVRRLTLIDPDEVDSVNLGSQGFYEADVGKPKVLAVMDRVAAVDRMAEITAHPEAYRPELVPGGGVVFACVDSIRVRRQIFRDFRERDWPLLLDGRMAAESLRVFLVPRDPGIQDRYRESLFPSQEAYREGCTARATIYCATLAGAILCAQFKKWAMGQAWEAHLHIDLVGMEIFT